MASSTPKPPIGERIRSNEGNPQEQRQSNQKIPRNSGGTGGAQGPPGVSVGDPNSLKIQTCQVQLKEDDFRCNVKLFEVPQGWAFEVLNCRVECYAGYPGNGTTTEINRRWRVAVDPEWPLALPAVVAWGEIGVTPCNPPGIGGGIVDFYHWQHPSTPGEVSVLTSSFTVSGEVTSRKCYPFRPFLVNPLLSRAISVNLYTKYIPATYGSGGQVFPASNFIVRVEYWLKEVTHNPDFGDDEREWIIWDPPHTSDGTCPAFPA